MKTLLAFAALAAFNLASAQKTTVLNEFKELTVGADLHVTLVKSNENKLVAMYEEEELHVQNNGDNLVLDGEAGTITVYYNGALESIVAGSDAVITTTDEIKSATLTVTAGSDARVTLTVNVKNLNTAAGSDAQVTLSGKADNHAATYASDAQLNAKELTTHNTDIVMSSDASGDITVKGNVNATVSSDASLKIYGNPKKVNQVTGSDARVVVVK
ncbi:GIN domain-containing protein [Flavobacterium sp. RHBU_24]|uniref:GIN domain-containing protein n=1 Tax=Flavobacterium sp. RHBU_24 TaxID=3391185 RepID=UPI003984F3B8